jgi:hypothetical protein
MMRRRATSSRSEGDEAAWGGSKWKPERVQREIGQLGKWVNPIHGLDLACPTLGAVWRFELAWCELLYGVLEVVLDEAVVDSGEVVNGLGAEWVGAVDVVGGAVGEDGSGAVEPCDVGDLAVWWLAEFQGEEGGWVLGELEEDLELAAAEFACGHAAGGDGLSVSGVPLEPDAVGLVDLSQGSADFGEALLDLAGDGWGELWRFAGEVGELALQGLEVRSLVRTVGRAEPKEP